MKITITHDFETLAEAEEFLDKMACGTTATSNRCESVAGMPHPVTTIVNAAGLAPSALEADGNVRAEKPPRKSKSKPKIDTSEKPVESLPLPLMEPAAKIEPAELQAATDALFEAKGLRACIDLLARYGAAKVRELVPVQYAEYKAEAEELARG